MRGNKFKRSLAGAVFSEEGDGSDSDVGEGALAARCVRHPALTRPLGVATDSPGAPAAYELERHAPSQPPPATCLPWQRGRSPRAAPQEHPRRRVGARLLYQVAQRAVSLLISLSCRSGRGSPREGDRGGARTPGHDHRRDSPGHQDTRTQDTRTPPCFRF